LKSLFIKFARLVLALTASSLLLAACGGGGSGDTASSPENGTATVTAVVSPSHVVAGRIYTYQATASSGSTVTWSWGDGTPDAVGSTVQKVWNKSGSFTTTLSATAGGAAATVTQATVVVGSPVSAGRYHTCALQPGGTVLCWGNNSDGQLGNGSVVGGSTATVAVTGLTDAVALSAGALHTCALKANGSVVCWGRNAYGQLGDGSLTSRTTPVAVTGLSDVVAVTAGGAYTCALKTNRNVVCWGWNVYGQLGDSTTTDRTTTVAVTGLTDAVAVNAGGAHTCALKANGITVCWGYNSSGQLGDGTTTDRTKPVAVTGLTDAVALSASFLHTCALKVNGSVACWGNNMSGELGDGTTVTRTNTVAVTGLTNAVAISAGGNSSGGIVYIYLGRTCAVKANGSTVCWGDKSYNSESGEVQAQVTPSAVVGLTDTVAVSVSRVHTCVLKANGAIACWGNNTDGQVGDGSVGGVKLVAVTAQGGGTGLLTDVVKLSASYSHTCALKKDKTVTCWGDNKYGQLGDGTTTTRIISAAVTGLTDVAALTVGWGHTCALKIDGSVVCWGYNGNGQLGNGIETQYQTIPTAVIGLTGAVAQLSAGNSHTCALQTNGSVFCWGSGPANGTWQNQTTPTAVIGLTGTATQLIAGYDHTCAVLETDGSVACWGNIGLLGSGTPQSQSTPTVVIGLAGAVTQLSAGYAHTCAVLKKDGSVVCWGYNYNGQLGNGSTTQSFAPTPVIGLTDAVTQLSTNWTHTCAVLKTDGSLVCWGQNDYGQLGGSPAQSQATPTAVIGLPDTAEQVSAGWDHTCAILKTDSSVVCWGYNYDGRLGGNIVIDTSIKLSPTAVLGGAIFWK
jgi:alpha-tubulin suppressor-like RCC1 family protein